MQLKNMAQKNCNTRLNYSIKDVLREDNSHNNKMDDIFDPNSNAHVHQEKIHYKRKAYQFYFEKVSIFLSSRKVVISLFFLISIIFHFLFIESIYHLAQNKVVIKNESKPIAFKINPPEENQPPKQAVFLKPVPKTEKPKHATDGKSKKYKIKAFPSSRLEAIGRAHMDMVREGKFPPMILSYRDPFSYVRQMYNLGSKTVVYDMSTRSYYETDLLGGTIVPFSNSDFIGFSFFKRVIKDSQWHKQKIRAASRLNTSPESLEILLLVPMPVETRWTGHQVNVFRQMSIPISNVETVEAQFHGSKLSITSIYLNDGTSRIVNDKIGA